MLKMPCCSSLLEDTFRPLSSVIVRFIPALLEDGWHFPKCCVKSKLKAEENGSKETLCYSVEEHIFL